MVDVFLADRGKNAAGLAAVIKELANLPDRVKPAMSRAMNHAMAGVRTEVVKEITNTYFIKAKDVRDTMYLRPASPGHLEAVLHSSGPAVPMIDFKVSPKTPARLFRKTGVRVQIRRDAPGDLTRYFIAKMPTGHTGVFRRDKGTRPYKSRYMSSLTGVYGTTVGYHREGRANKVGWTWLPIKEVTGPAVPSMMKGVLQVRESGLMNRARDRFESELQRQLDLVLMGKGK